MKGRIDNKMGSIQIDPEVIAMYAGTTAVECFGCFLSYYINLEKFKASG